MAATPSNISVPITAELETLGVQSEAATIAELARAATEPIPLDADGVVLVRNTDGGYDVVDGEPFAAHPRRKRGRFEFSDSPSFIEYVRGHLTAATVLYRTARREFLAVINDHTPGGDAGFRDHAVHLALHTSPAFDHWAQLSGAMIDQVTMAEHLEARMGDIVDPAAADLLELVQFLDGTVSVNWTAAERLRDGARKLQWAETVTARGNVQAGGARDVPGSFTVAVPLFRHDVSPTTFEARIRFRVRDQKLTIGYHLVDVDDIIDEGVHEVAVDIHDELGLFVHNQW